MRDGLTIRRPTVEDGPAVWRLVVEGGGLDPNSPYLYLVMCSDFADTCRVAYAGDDLVGFVVGYHPPTRPDAYFVWQVASAPAARGKGLGKRLIRAVLNDTGARWLEATVTPSNAASRRLFASVARSLEAPLEWSDGFAADLFPTAGDAPHEREDRLRIGPLRS